MSGAVRIDGVRAGDRVLALDEEASLEPEPVGTAAPAEGVETAAPVETADAAETRVSTFACTSCGVPPVNQSADATLPSN